jgi:two-component system chemotaxis response regulator CheY
MKILIVDDSTMLREMLTYALNEGGYLNVDEAKDGVDGLQKAQSTIYNLVITDINMPNMDGLRFVQELRALSEYKQTPILVLTTERGEDMKIKGKRSGATGWIVKPFIPDQLIKAVNIVLNKNKKV